jgi:chemotaxis signal transduction protein
LEFLAFTLGQEEYGIDIQKVQELRGYETVTRIANAPEFIKGVVNLRGIIVPIIDMRVKFNLGSPTFDQFTVVITRSACCRCFRWCRLSIAKCDGVTFARVYKSAIAVVWDRVLKHANYRSPEEVDRVVNELLTYG